MRMTKLARGAAILIAAGLTIGVTATTATATGDEPDSSLAEQLKAQGYELTFADEFHTFDSSTWTKSFREKTSQYIHPGDEKFGYTESQVQVTSEGTLRLTGKNSPLTVAERTVPNRSGAVTSRYGKTFTYGYFEARFRVNQNSPAGWSFVPAFWMDAVGDSDNRQHTPGGAKSAIPSGNGAEVDVIEVAGGGSVSGDGGWALHRSDAAGNGVGSLAGPRTTISTGDWHTASVLWTPTGYTFYVDGTQLGSPMTAGTISNTPMYLMLTAAAHNLPASGSATVDFDYVRVYQSPTITAAHPPVAWTGFDRGAWKATASSTAGKYYPTNTIKTYTGSPQPFWRAGGTSQAGNEWFMMDLGTLRTLNQLRIASPTDAVATYATGYEIYLADDPGVWRQPNNASWGAPVATGVGAPTIDACFPEQTHKYVMIKQTGTHPTRSWAIRDIYAFNSSTPPLTGTVCG